MLVKVVTPPESLLFQFSIVVSYTPKENLEFYICAFFIIDFMVGNLACMLPLNCWFISGNSFSAKLL